VSLSAGEIKAFKAYKAWSASVAGTPRPTADPLAPPKPSKKKAGKRAGADDSMALVAAIRGKVSCCMAKLYAEGKHLSGMISTLHCR
jgi:hypothetical protein